MRKVTSIFLLSIYLLASVGLYGNVHYCQGEVDSVQWILDNKMSCCMAAASHCVEKSVADHCMEKSTDPSCCDDEAFYMQLDSDQSISYTKSGVELAWIPTQNQIFHYSSTLDESANIDFAIDPPPPESALFILYQQLLFYH
ncbi:MAG: hypothetical protein AAFO07_13590 [Bacteroidota bacterium]